MKKNRSIITIIIILQLSIINYQLSIAQQVQRIHPINWWVGMKDSNLQLCVYGKNIAQTTVTLNYLGVKLKKINKVENPNYLFLDVEISKTAKAGKMPLTFINGKEKTTILYELGIKKHKPLQVTSADFIYLIMPDRFSDGDPTNNKFADMADTSSSRKSPWLRHGGDLKGIENHLDYFKELGVTALWLNPVTENDQPLTNENGTMRSAYHGYGFTDHYKIDKRLGGNDAYKKLIDSAHKNGYKIIQDAVYNHAGVNHWFLKDMPSKDWVNQWPIYTNTSYKDQPLLDPHTSEIDKKTMSDGWFVPFLPDLNQRNPFVANYLIQNALWQVEEFGIDSWRIDTYMYNDMPFMNRCNQALTDNYPSLLLFGESVASTIPNQAYFTKNNLNLPFKCNLESTCDFQLASAMLDAVNQNYGWNDGINKLYQALSQDYLYQDAAKNVIFLDNHDTDRYVSLVGEDMNKFKMGLTFLMTTRGIPHIYYGTETFTKNFKNPTDAEVRKDFPGGFAGDSVNHFVASGRNKIQNEAFDFIKKIAQYRKNTPALHSGKLMQYLPKDGVYIYFKYDKDKTVMVATNTNKTEQSIATERYTERMNGFKMGKNILTDETLTNLKTLKIPAMTALVIELGK